MDFIDRLANSVKLGARPSERKDGVISLQSSGVQRLSAAPKTDSASLLQGYRSNGLVRASVNILAESITDPRLIVQERPGDDEWIESIGHPFKRLLMRPNPQMDEAMFFKFAQTSIEVMGVFYAEIVRSGALPVELWPIQPQAITPKYRTNRDGSKELTHYKYKDGMYEKNIPAEDMLVRDDLVLGGRLSPLATAMRSVDSDWGQSDYIRSFFNNAGVPSGILKLHYVSNDEEILRMKSQWRAEYGRQYGNQHGLAVLDANADYQRLGAMLGELDSQSLRGFDESRICMAFGVPPLIVYAYVGLLRATYSNLDEAWAQFWKTTMSAKMKSWRSFFSVSLLELFEERESILSERSRLYWDIANVGALQESAELIAEREGKVFERGGMTLDEYRAAVGRQPYQDAEMGVMNYFELRLASGGVLGGIANLDGDPGAADAEMEEPKAIAPVTAVKESPAPVTAVKESPEDEERRLLKEYKLEVKHLANAAKRGDLDKDEFIEKLRALSATNLVAAFVLGAVLKDDGELTDYELETIGAHIKEASRAAAGFADDIWDGRYGGVHRDEDAAGEGADIEERAGKWAAAAGAVLVLGRVFRRDDPVLRWQQGATMEPCGDCSAFNGTAMKASLWRQLWDQGRLPKGRGLECAGYNCACDLIPE